MRHTILDEIYKASLNFLHPLDTKEMYTIVMAEAARLVGAKDGTILLANGNEELVRVYATSPAMYKIKPRRRGIMYNVFKSGKPVVLTSSQIEKIHPEIKEAAMQTDIVVPLSYKNESIGVLSVFSHRGKTFTDHDLRILTYFAPLATLAIRKTQLHNQIKEALATRDLFIAMASHELKTPLTAIQGYVQLLYRKLALDNSLEAKWVENLRFETSRLTKLINGLLTMNAIQTGKFNIQKSKYSLIETINRAISEFEFSYPKHKVVFHRGHLPSIVLAEIDFDKIVQVVANVLNNAAKFSPPQKKITVALKNNSDFFIISIRDQGAGIAKDDLKRVFESFYKGKNNYQSGMGLGLFLSRNIIKEHGGDMQIDSESGKGTTVKILLPKKEEGNSGD